MIPLDKFDIWLTASSRSSGSPRGINTRVKSKYLLELVISDVACSVRSGLAILMSATNAWIGCPVCIGGTGLPIAPNQTCLSISNQLTVASTSTAIRSSLAVFLSSAAARRARRWTMTCPAITKTPPTIADEIEINATTTGSIVLQISLRKFITTFYYRLTGALATDQTGPWNERLRHWLEYYSYSKCY